MVLGSCRRRTRAGVYGLLVTAVLGGCTGTGQAAGPPGPVTIGLLAPVTGPGAGAGTDAVRGAQLAVDVVNHSHPQLPVSFAAGVGLPSLAGRQLALVSADTTGTPGDAANEATGMVANHTVAVMVADSAEVAAAAGSQTQRLRVPLVDAFSTADYVTELGMDWYFRTVPSDRMLVETTFGLLQRQLADIAEPRVAILTEAGAQDAATTAVVRDFAERAGYTVATQRTFGQADQQHDLSKPTGVNDQAKQIDQDRADVILALVRSRSGATAVTQVAARLGRPLPVIGFGPGFDDQGKDHAAVILHTSSWSAGLARRSPAGKAVSDLYASRFGTPMTNSAANAFTATITLATAIDAAGSDDPAAIRTALRQSWQPATGMIMPWNGIRFDANGQNELAAGVVEARVATILQVIFPRELAAGPMIWTVPKAIEP